MSKDYTFIALKRLSVGTCFIVAFMLAIVGLRIIPIGLVIFGLYTAFFCRLKTIEEIMNEYDKKDLTMLIRLTPTGGRD